MPSAVLVDIFMALVILKYNLYSPLRQQNKQT